MEEMKIVILFSVRLLYFFIIISSFFYCINENQKNNDEKSKESRDAVGVVDSQAVAGGNKPEDFMSYWRDFRRVILERDESMYADYVNIPLEIGLHDNVEYTVEDRSLLPRIINGFVKSEPVLVITTLSHTLQVPYETPWLHLDYYNCIARLDTDLKSWDYVFGIDTTDTTHKGAEAHAIEEDDAWIGGQMEFRRIEGKWKLARLIVFSKDDISYMLGKEALSRADTVVGRYGGMEIIIR